MPLFHKKFTLPKLPSRKSSSMTNLSHLDTSVRSQEYGLDYGSIKARLSGRDLVFNNGKWIVDDTGCANGSSDKPKNAKECARITRENKKLTEENNLLKLKVDLLLDMLTETTAEVHLQESEIENLRAVVNRKHGGIATNSAVLVS